MQAALAPIFKASFTSSVVPLPSRPSDFSYILFAHHQFRIYPIRLRNTLAIAIAAGAFMMDVLNK